MIPQQTLVHQYLGTQPVRRAYLFGSRARGEASAESDVDIVVELEDQVTLFDFVRVQIPLEELLHVPVGRSGISQWFIDSHSALHRA